MNSRATVKVHSPCIIVIDPATGVEYKTEAGGHACHHESVVGYCIPLDPQSVDLMQTDLYPYFEENPWVCEGIETDLADLIDATLSNCLDVEYEHNFRVDRTKLHMSQEAFVYLTGTRGAAVLIFQNSD